MPAPNIGNWPGPGPDCDSVLGGLSGAAPGEGDDRREEGPGHAEGEKSE